MKRIIVMTLMIPLVLVNLTGCGKDSVSSDTKQEKQILEKNTETNTVPGETTEVLEEFIQDEMEVQEQSQTPNDQPTQTTSHVEQNPVQEKEQKENTVQEKSETENSEENDTTLIIKSDTVVSNKEKEEILNEIDKLLDDIVKNIDELEDVEAEDIEINN
ncbi:MAG: hypothetical protein ACOYVK_22020 [Bacillota bacterium]